MPSLRRFTFQEPGTEWFRRSDALLVHIGGLAAGVDDPWALHARWLSEAVARAG